MHSLIFPRIERQTNTEGERERRRRGGRQRRTQTAARLTAGSVMSCGA